jgi:hypothetical protein
MPRLIQLFDRPCCGTSSAQALADFLSERLDDEAEVHFHDLNEPGTASISVPTALITHLTSAPAGPLPVMLVDGRLVAAGMLPNYFDALEYATGDQPPAPVRLPLAGAEDRGGGSACCP